MTGLALKLAPNEQIMINGVIVENGPRRAQLLIKSENASVLRLRDALDEEEVIGTASRAYFVAQQAVAGIISLEEARMELERLFHQLNVMPEFSAFSHGLKAGVDNLSTGNLYRVMRGLRPLVSSERCSLSRSRD